MDGKIDTMREAFEQWCMRENGKWGKKVIERHDDGRYCVMQTYMDWSAWQAGYSAALSAIDPEAIRTEALVEKVITFFNNRLTIGETEDECGDLVSVLELDKDFRSDLAKMLSVVDPEAIRRECAEQAIVYIEKTYESINRDAIRAAILSAILYAEPAQDESKEVDHEAEC